LIDIPASTPRGPTNNPKVHRMLAELRDHNPAPSSATLQPRGKGHKRHRARPGACAFGTDRFVTDKPMSCAVAAIVALVMWIAGVDVLEPVNERFPPLNNIGVSFAMISSVDIVHELIDWKFLPVESTKRGSTLWKSKLFRELDVGFYWVQLDLRDSAQFTAEHVIAVHVIKDWKLCDDPEENVVCLLDNRGREDFVQVKDIDVKRGTDAGENILSLFLGIPDSRITSIINLKPRAEKNSSYARAAQTAGEFKDKRMTRHLSLQTSVSDTSVKSSKASIRRKRGTKRARGRKSAPCTVERVSKRIKRTSPSGPKL